MSKPPKFPEKSDTEKAMEGEQLDLMRFQRDMLNEQMRRQDLLAPLLYKQAGITPQYDANGNIVGFAEVNPNDPQTALNKEIERRFSERTLAALKGELPQDPGLMRELQEGESQLHESLRKQLGSGYATSSPGMEALSNFGKRRSEILDAARRGDLTLAEQLGLARGASNLGQAAGSAEMMAGSLANSLRGNTGFGALANLYNAPQQLGLQNRQGIYGANFARWQQGPLNRFLMNPMEEFLMSSANQAGKMAGGGGMMGMMG